MEWDWQFGVKIIVSVGTVVGALSGMFGLFWWLISLYYAHKFKEIETLKDECKNKADSIQKMGDAHSKIIKEKSDLERRLKRSKQVQNELGQKLDTVQEQRTKEYSDYDKYRANLKRAREQLEAEMRKLKADLAVKSQSHVQLEMIRERVKTISSLDGKLWNRPIPAGAPFFTPRNERKSRLISIVNLKGGVGKTTITANLATALAETSRVLMIDLDFQRSLSRLWLDDQERLVRHLAKRCVQHFLSAPDHRADELLAKIGDVMADPANCWFLSNSDSVREGATGPGTENNEDDSLEETEMRLMFDWIFQANPNDIRFHLREGLHHPKIHAQFDYVLMDCPPRLTTACINGLAASDYVLVPVTLDAMATNSVPYLLKNLKALKSVLPHLEVIGVVANKVKMSSGYPVSEHDRAWGNLKDQCSRLVPSPFFFSSMIHEDSAIGSFATQAIEEGKRTLRQTQRYVNTNEAFAKLAAELKKEIATREVVLSSDYPPLNVGGDAHGSGNTEISPAGAGTGS